MRELRIAAAAVLALTMVLGLAYPLAMTGASQVLFSGAADGSLVRHDGRVVGSRLIGQDFAKDPSLFQSRPPATKYAGDATFFNNQGPNQRALADQLKARLAAYLKREHPFTPGLRAAAVPADAVTTSASGIDPQISYANAAIQANRVARERGLTRGRVMALVDEHVSRPLFGLAGERSVNVLELNLALEAVGR